MEFSTLYFDPNKTVEWLAWLDNEKEVSEQGLLINLKQGGRSAKVSKFEPRTEAESSRFVPPKDNQQTRAKSIHETANAVTDSWSKKRSLTLIVWEWLCQDQRLLPLRHCDIPGSLLARCMKGWELLSWMGSDCIRMIEDLLVSCRSLAAAVINLAYSTYLSVY